MGLEDRRRRRDLLALYQATSYRAELPSGVVTIRVGRISAELDLFLSVRGIRSWAFLSAANPGSVRLGASENEVRHAFLGGELARSAWEFYPAIGDPDDPGWEAEPSFIVLGISVDAAADLARSFGQAAIVAGTLGCRAEIVWC